MALPITIHLTEAEADALHDLLDWAGEHIGDILDAAGSHDHWPIVDPAAARAADEERAALEGNDKEISELFKPLFNISQTVTEKVEGTVAENIIMGMPGACPHCKEDGRKPPYLLEHTGSDAHCDHEEERNYSCQNCGCLFDEVWMYSHKEVTRRGRPTTATEE